MYTCSNNTIHICKIHNRVIETKGYIVLSELIYRTFDGLTRVLMIHGVIGTPFY